jgi:N-acetylglucosaminyl-diphospho-decaprenol L-rhamnosyltransferase
MNRFSTLVVTYNSGPYLEVCLKAIQKQTTDKTEVILWNNGDKHQVIPIINEAFPDIILCGSGMNLGFAAANNKAAQMAKGDWLILINPDAFIAEDFMQEVSQAITDYPDIPMFACVQIEADNSEKLDGLGDGMSFFGFPYRMGYGRSAQDIPVLPVEVFGACGAALIVRRDLFMRLGGFDEAFFCYCEDADFSYRARLSGSICLLMPKIRVAHMGSAALGVRSDFALYHGYRNRLWLFIKNTPFWLLCLGLPFHLTLTLLLSLMDCRTGHAEVVFRALKDGLLGLPLMIKKRKSASKVNFLHLVRILTWSPLCLFQRRLKNRAHRLKEAVPIIRPTSRS